MPSSPCAWTRGWVLKGGGLKLLDVPPTGPQGAPGIVLLAGSNLAAMPQTLTAVPQTLNPAMPQIILPSQPSLRPNRTHP